MALLLKNGAVFLHIPKTGGNWVSKVLEELNLVEKHIPHKHADIDHFFAPPRGGKAIIIHAIHELFSKRTNKPFMFCFVRNPLSWYESWFKYMVQLSRQWRFWGDERDPYNWHPNALLNGSGSSDFNEFVKNVIIKRPGYVSEMYGWYTKPQMDFVGKQEHLVDDFIRVLRTMSVDFDEKFVRDYGKIGVSPEKKTIWQDELKRKVALYEYAGMIRYGYHSTLTDLGIDVDHLTSRAPDYSARLSTGS
jgi:hypothetical protein